MASVMDSVPTPGDTFATVAKLEAQGLTLDHLEALAMNPTLCKQVADQLEPSMPGKHRRSST